MKRLGRYKMKLFEFSGNGQLFAQLRSHIYPEMIITALLTDEKQAAKALAQLERSAEDEEEPAPLHDAENPTNMDMLFKAAKKAKRLLKSEFTTQEKRHAG